MQGELTGRGQLTMGAIMLTTETCPELAFLRLVRIVARLRDPQGGCPWDLEQTPQTATPYLLEESFEAVEAIEAGDMDESCEELGDVLLQVVFQTQMIHDTSAAFCMTDVANGVADKMIRRHPHVFGDEAATSSSEVLQRWEQIKAKEKSERQSMLDGLPKGLPALLHAFRLGQKASRVGFDWQSDAGTAAKIQEECTEFLEATQRNNQQDCIHELGDLLFAIAQHARHLGLDPEAALRSTNRRFTSRFNHMEQNATSALDTLSAQEWEDLWSLAKASETQVNDL